MLQKNICLSMVVKTDGTLYSASQPKMDKGDCEIPKQNVTSQECISRIDLLGVFLPSGPIVHTMGERPKLPHKQRRSVKCSDTNPITIAISLYTCGRILTN